MASFFIVFLRFFRATKRALGESEFSGLLKIIALLLISGTVFYHFVEGWRFLDSLYFSVTTLTTVAYGDFHPITDIGKIFTMLYVLVGVGLMFGFIATVAREAQKEPYIGKVVVRESYERTKKFINDTFGEDDEDK